MSGEVSPDSKCPICLDIFHNISYLDRCLHMFCFRCIREWSKNIAECPLCKRPFSSIYHSIKSEQDFKTHHLQPVNNGSSPPPDNGVLFEGFSSPSKQCRDRYIRCMILRLAAKRKAASEGRAVNNVPEQEMINFRRELYRREIRVLTVVDGGRSRDTSAEFYRRNPACLHRLIPWLKRELNVLYGSHGSFVNLVQHIISRITRFDMEDVAIQEELRPFIWGCMEHFLHEFISFAKSPFNMEAYDQHAVYDCPPASSDEDSGSSSSVIAISEDEDSSAELEHFGEPSVSSLSHSLWDDETPGPSYSTTAEKARAECLSVVDSDSDSSLEEEPLGFGTPPDQTHTTQVDPECFSSDSDDCVIVSVIKATAERTPELVQLSSDESGREDAKEVPLFPQHIRFSSLSPPASQGSNRSVGGWSDNVDTAPYRQIGSTVRRSSPTSGRLRTSSRSGRKSKDRGPGKERTRERPSSKGRDERRRKRRSRSRSCHRGGDVHSIGESNYKKGDTYERYQSHRRYDQDRHDTWTPYTERQSSYYSSSKYSNGHSYTGSRSDSRDSRRRDGTYSRSVSGSRSPSTSAKGRSHHHDKPGGKRKYKTRHLEETSQNIILSLLIVH